MSRLSLFGFAVAVMAALGVAGCGPGEEPVEGVRIGGTVKTYAGTPLSGYRVMAVDSRGPKPEVLTDADGAFAIPEVELPYSISVVPVGVLRSYRTALTFAGVTRTDPTLVIHGSDRDPPCTGLDKVMVTVTGQPVPAGHTARLYFIGDKIAPSPLASNVRKNLAEGEDVVTLEVPLQKFRCPEQLPGSLLYIEYDAAAQITRTAIQALTLEDGVDSVRQSLTATAASIRSVSGQVTLPPGVTGATVSLHLKIGNAYGLHERINLTAGSTAFTFAVPKLPGLEYRVQVTSPSGAFAFSPVLAADATVNLSLPVHPQAVGPQGLADAPQPTFVREASPTSDLYMTLVRTNGANSWIGISATPSITMPALPAPATLTAGDEFQWLSYSSFKMAPGVDVDALLDGRLVESLFYLDWISAPEFVSSGTQDKTEFNFFLPVQ